MYDIFLCRVMFSWKLRWLYLIDCEVLIVDYLIEELELTPLKVKGWKALEGREPLKIGGIENVLEILRKLAVRVFRGVCW